MDHASSSGPTIVAHRGLHRRHPENSLSAFEAAWGAGFAWCECDVHLAADLTPLVIHDDAFERTTTAVGRVSDAFAWAQAKLRGADGSPLAERVPTLREVVGRVPADGGRLLVEIKPSDWGETVRHVMPLLSAERCVVQSFDPANLRHARARDPRMKLAWLIERAEDLPRALAGEWDAVHCLHGLMDASVMLRARQAGKRVGVWTPTTEAELRRVIGLGVDLVITDAPELAREILRGAAGP